MPPRIRLTIQCLPNELLEVVFAEGACAMPATDSQYPSVRLFTKLDPPQPLVPIVLSHVCRRWRALVFQTPVLWSYLPISRSTQAHRRLKSELGLSLAWLPLFIGRSERVPLHIFLDCTRLPLEETLRMIVPHSWRWSSLVIIVTHVGSLPTILRHLTDIVVPSLECLSIAADIYREGMISIEPIPSFFTHDVPRLSTLRLKGVYLAWNGPPLVGLTTLELRFTSRWPPFFSLRALFDASPRLRRLIIQNEISSILHFVDQPQARPKVELRHLRYLDIEVCRPSSHRSVEQNVAGLIGLFAMPRLETLALRCLRASEWMSVANFFKRRTNIVNFPLLQSLILSCIEGELTADLSLREAFPRLTHLSLTNVHSNAFLEVLLEDEDRNVNQWQMPVWPYLESLNIFDDQYCSFALLQSVVRCRQMMGRPHLSLVLDKRYATLDQSSIEWLGRATSLSLGS
ncbi:hypothetical protein BDQ17DRAFT_1312956 [Cyathus striatus]|nr:hypothetical protein BDQ17DRAFT_1312956 [Cyathus striatus]